MLLMRQFDGVEKIKTIGSTYMAAAGLRSSNTACAAVSNFFKYRGSPSSVNGLSFRISIQISKKTADFDLEAKIHHIYPIIK